jgi:CO/xanthine dehydrogenase Mo-binding subunit
LGGLIAIHRLVACECGAIVTPAGLRSQAEGARVRGRGGALFEAIHRQAGRVANASCNGCRVPRLRDAPPIDVALVNRPDVPPAGAGETPLRAIAPAAANAIFAATGERRRSLRLCMTARAAAPARVYNCMDIGQARRYIYARR